MDETSKEARRLLEAEALPHLGLVRAVALRMTGNAAQADDLAQETFLRAFRSAANYRLGSNCKAWLLTILRSAYLDAGKAEKVRGGPHQELPEEVVARIEHDKPADLATILDIMFEDEVQAGLLQLPELYREAVVLVFITGLTYCEAAKVMRVEVGTVKSRVFRACQMLKKVLWNHAVERRIVPAEAATETKTETKKEKTHNEKTL